MSEARRARRRRPLRAALLLLLAALMAFLLLNSKYSLTVTDYSLSYPSLTAEFDGFRIVQLSDLHGAEFGEGSSRLVAAVRAQSPDIIALTGDFLDEGKTDDELPRLRVLVSALSAIAPVYFVSGNHDWASGEIDALAETLEECGAVYLRNEYVEIWRGGASIVLCGVEDPNGFADMIKPDALVAGLRGEHPDSFALLLGHRNYWLERYPQLDIDLALCGHAHGGIVRLPFLGGVLGSNARLFPEYDAGLFHGRYDLIVSRGLGNSVPVPRFLNVPEIVSVTLSRA